jgi:hypothetical protein
MYPIISESDPDTVLEFYKILIDDGIKTSLSEFYQNFARDYILSSKNPNPNDLIQKLQDLDSYRLLRNDIEQQELEEELQQQPTDIKQILIINHLLELVKFLFFIGLLLSPFLIMWAMATRKSSIYSHSENLTQYQW